MNIVESVKEYVIKMSEDFKSSDETHYDFWNEHIKRVLNESVKLANKYGADVEIVSLGALLHDIALINRVGDKKDHHINGEIIAREVLEDLNYDSVKKERVLKCVYNHRSSKNAESIEETCVADADILAHFDNIPMLFHSAFVRNKVELNDIKKWLEKTFEKDYNDLSDKTKEAFKNRYRIIKDVVIR